MTNYIFLEDSHEPQGGILVAKQDWFTKTPICQTRTQSGQLAANEMEGEHDGETCCESVLAYEYWDGSNHQTIEIGGDYENRYSEITGDAEIAKYTELVEKARTDDNYPFEERSTGYKSCEIDGYRITESIWQGAWELYTIQEIEG